MAKKFLTQIDMGRLEIRNLLLHIIAGDATTPTEGQVWYDSTAQRVKIRRNSVTSILVTDGGDLTAGSVLNTALATNPLLRTNHTGTQLAASISDFDTQVRTSTLNQMAAPTAALSVNSQRITNVATPTTATDAATMGYVDTAVTGLSWKSAVRVATTANITLSAPQTIDGVAVVAGDRVLVKNQTTSQNNGIYLVAAGAWTRTTDNDTAAEMLGAAVMAQEGTANQNTQWIQTVDAAITLNTTPLTWSQFGGGQAYTAGNGLLLSANAFSAVADTGILVTGSGIAVNSAVVVKKYAVTIGNGSLTSIAVNHALNTKDVTFSVRQVSDDAFVECDAVSTDVNNLTLSFAVAPTASALRVTVHG